ncbi:AI-2E family transporter [Evtepia gabavorous]|uniref:AI-2E family transporter n=1 Tax=Evtepia gabavorous TaxID=2211183 RepID=UPI003A8F080F
MDLNKKNMKRIALLIAFGLLLYWGLNHPGQAGRMLSTVFSIFLPFLLGGCLAFLLNVILRPVERGWRCAWGKRYGPRQKRAQRPVCLLVSTLLLVGVVFAIFFIVVPALKDSVVNFVSLLPSRLVHLEHWWNDLVGFLEAHSIQLPEFSLNSTELQNNITSFLSKYGEDFLNTTIGITSSIFSLVVNLVLALAFSLYLLAQKETLTGQAKKVVRALFSEKWAHWITDVARMTNRTFSNFVTGQLTEAVILGTLCFLGMLIFRLPYAGVISVLVGFTALIPIFGAFIGVGIGAFLILLVSPIKALWFILFFVILQQLEGNLIYPRVVGKSVGLPGIWVLAAVTVGGNAFGLAGMLLAVPLCSVLYTLARQGVNARLARKGLSS